MVAFITFAMGILSKEVAIAFVPGMFLILWARNVDGQLKGLSGQSLVKWLPKLLLMLVLSGGIVWLFVLLRQAAFAGSSFRIGMTLKFIFNDLYYAMFVCLRAFGFYVKKFFMPYPLNFAILGVDPLYELLAMILVVGCFILLCRRNYVSAFILTGVALLTPAFPIAFSQIAWTPYAERYVYISTAFFVVALVCWCGRYLSHKKISSLGLALSVVLVCVSSAATYQRSLVWHSNLLLWQDTTVKSPLHASAWNDYGVALFHEGEFEKAKEMYQKAASLNGLFYKEKYDLNYADVFVEQGRYEEAKKTYAAMHEKSKGRSKGALRVWRELLERQISQAGSSAEKESLEAELRGMPVLMSEINEN